ncbi:insecticyanin-B-like [Arctopsyche grandis]|uniref:insecticyanin-B-like n=1 Tax=Arctopsyche grandis TaxID=121162 RepID=UPI00406D748E
MWLFKFILIVIAIVNTNELVLNDKCEELNPELDLDWISIFNGKWYQIQRYPDGNDVQCIELYFNKTSDSNYTLHFHGMENKEMVHEHAEVFIENEYTGTFKIDDREIKVLGTDPESYAILHECNFNATSNQRTIHSWIFSREMYLKPSSMENVTDLFTANISPELNLTLYEPVVHWGETCNSCSFNGALLSLIVTCVAIVKTM